MEGLETVISLHLIRHWLVAQGENVGIVRNLLVDEGGIEYLRYKQWWILKRKAVGKSRGMLYMGSPDVGNSRHAGAETLFEAGLGSPFD